MKYFYKCIRLFTKLSDSQINVMKKGLPKKRHINGVNKIILVSSAKGGVGKSTIASNLAISLIDKTPNQSIGLLDADIFGPSQPQLFNLQNIIPQTDSRDQIIPLNNYGLKIMSMGFLIDSNAAVVWRGLMVMSAIEKLLFQVNWGNIDCLVVDMPPGTGDVQLSICQRLFIDGSILVTTPQQLSIIDVNRGFVMFQKMGIPVLGYISNMSHFICTHCSQKHELFGKKQSKNPFETEIEKLAEFPIENRSLITEDIGQPITICDPMSSISVEYNRLAENIWKNIC